MAKYKYTPFCPHCGHQVFNVVEISHVVERPELWKNKVTCQHCYKTFTGEDVIYPEKTTSEIYESLVAQMEDFKVLKVWDMNKRKLLEDLGVVPNYMKMLMHGVPDTAPRHDIKFRWVWNDMLLNPGYTLQFEYRGKEYEIYAPMVNDRYLNYLDTYLDLTQQVVEDYLDGIDKRSM